jgi:DNA-binding CsgD family transcriptional regulator
MPDVLVEDRIQLRDRAKNNIDISLADLAKRDGVSGEPFWPFTWEEATLDGAPYGLPYETDIRVLFYNKAVFKDGGLDPEKPPQTMDELWEYADKLTIRDGDRIERLRDAIALLERSPARLELARSLVDLGAALRRAGHRTDARHPLRDGYELARACGAQTLAKDARQELAASGVRIRRARLTGAESLTPSERRIADMAADGNTNAEIAQALFVTVKTVEMHLTHVYRKLGIPGRGELARALAS